jgi:putative ABC transport system permease protein
MNLATARAANRAREVGIRKVSGASKNQLVRQFLGESILLSVFSGVSAVAAVAILLPAFNTLTGKELDLGSLSTTPFLLGTTAIVLAVGFLSGIYPAFVLSAFHPTRSLKGAGTRTPSGGVLRKGLVIFQFALSIAVIVSTMVVHSQMEYIGSRHLGYDRDRIMAIALNKSLRLNFAGFRNELLKHPGVENLTTSSLVPTRGSYHLALDFEGLEERLTQVIYMVDREFFDTYGLSLLAGDKRQRPISKETTWDYLVSERTVTEAGYDSPREAIGRRVDLEGESGRIVGVVKDINIYSLHRPAYPICYLVTPIKKHNYISIRFSPRNLPSTLDALQNTWSKMVPEYPLEYFFLDASFEQMHDADKKMGEVFSIFSLMAVVLACMGLFGLAAHTAAQKTKEIGIRKVLGASSPGLYFLLAREFLKWVALANLIAWPVAHYAMHRWLQNFFYRTSMGWEVFLIAAGAALALSLVTVSYQSLKAAVANPIDALRHE